MPSLKSRPGFLIRVLRRPRHIARLLPLVLALAVLATLAARPDLLSGAVTNASAVADSYDGYDAKGAEQLREDQCVAADALRKGGPNMFALAQGALGQPPDQLHVKFRRDLYDTNDPLHQAYTADETYSDQWIKKAEDQGRAWSDTVRGLDSYPGQPAGADKIYDQTGLLPWLWQSYFKSINLLYPAPYYDPSPTADEKAKAAALAIGDQLYLTGGTPQEQQAWALWKKNSGKIEPNQLFIPRVFADDARIFLSAGGFPRTAPAPDTPEFRVAVEDLKARFAACAWHDPIDPDRVLGKEVAQASAEWQQEITSQAAQRQKVLTANVTATKALQEGTFALGKVLGQSWIADYSTRWLDYYTEGGFNWIGDGQLEIQVPGAAGKCLDVAGGGKTNGTPVQVYTCNGGAAQKWQLWGSENGGYRLMNPNSSLKCLDVAGASAADGAKIQIRDCATSKAQFWAFDVHNPGTLRNVASGKCLHLPGFDNSKDAVLAACNGSSAQKFKVVVKTHTGSAPAKADVDKAKAAVTAAQAEAKKQLAVVKTQLTAAQKAATDSDTALQAAYTVADANGAPRGRGLLVGQQKAQVTRGAVASLAAMVKAGETAEAATRASAGDSQTIAQRALAQAAQSKAEFRKEAAKAAEEQAKAAADAAKLHRDNAKKDKETAEAELVVAVKAEGDARAAAADAHAKRLAAEAEEKTARAEKETAAARQAEAAGHKKNAQTQAAAAKDAQSKAEAAEATAESRRDDAVKARDSARARRDDAWDAEQKADAARAKADAKDAYAVSLDAGDAATAARSAADEADRHADDAEAAAAKARTEADAATQAAADADAAATRAEAAAERARSDADAAQAAKLKADAAVSTATSAAADAIQASKDAADEARTAVKLADEAEAHARDATTQADQAGTEAGKALAASAKAAGFAHVTAQAAVDAGHAAEQVADPANDAIQLGSPYVTTDSAAGLVVLTAQGSKTIAEQQQAVADAHAKNAQAEADAAKALAEKAQGDAKEAYQHAANAAAYAATARTYAKEALGYAAQAATAASKAAASLARTVAYDQQATADAAAADQAAGRAEGYAKDARDSADQAELDASAARTAAAQAEQSAKDARAAADRAAAAATEAEQAAKDADKYAKEAQEAASRTEQEFANQQVSAGAGTGVGGTFYVVDEDSVEVTDAKQQNPCEIEIGFEGCTVSFTVTFNATVDFYLCVDPDVPATSSGCPSPDTLFLKRQTFTGLKNDVTHYFSKLDLIKQTVVYQILKAVLVEDFVNCWHGSVSACAWAASNFIPGAAFEKMAEGIRVLDAALKTGAGVADAFKALKVLDVDPATLTKIEMGVNAYEDVITTCRVNSFPGDTLVLMADGTRRAIRDVREGDRVMAADPATGRLQAEPITDTFRHRTERLVTIALAGGSSLDTTAGHKMRTSDRGWVLAAELRPRDRLLSSDGTFRTVTGVRDRSGLAPRQVYDLTVDDLHTFYVRSEGPGAADVMVHNCLNLGDEDLKALEKYSSEIHTLKDHVRPDAAEAFRLASKKGQPNTIWTNQDVAQQAVDRVVGDYFSKRTASGQKVLDQEKWKKFQNWAAKARDGEQYPAITGTWDAYPSLGKRYHPDGRTIDNAGNEVVVILMKVKGHNGQGRYGFVVKTAYPK
ncbi:ricin-type beta-trefoil lectin domain protein [Streptomyces sp. NPDC047017]|uniref:RICIN domain-containing protein n=1 Tax=Streptomyces sp. NPDC047017 TaxID=3155024 RepID=UPI00340AEAE3